MSILNVDQLSNEDLRFAVLQIARNEALEIADAGRSKEYLEDHGYSNADDIKALADHH